MVQPAGQPLLLHRIMSSSGSMEPLPKRQRLDATTATRKTALSSEAHPGESRAHTSSYFDGAGVSNSHGNFRVSGDLVVNNNSLLPRDTDIDNARSMLLQSLKFDQMDARHLSIKKAHANTCSWVVQTKSYKQWEEQSSPQSKFLWIKGKPGAGKSTLMKFLLGQKESRIRKMRSHIRLISFFFNARGNDLERSIVGMYRSLLSQLLHRSPQLERLLDNLRPSHQWTDQWTVETLESLFEEAIQELKDTSVVCIIDALDECDENEIRDMIRFLSGLVETGSRLSVCFASRHYPHITLETALNIILEERDEHQRDIATYLNSALRIGQGSLAEQISSELQEKACGIFMWVVLVVDILNREYDDGRKHSLRERLQQIPGDLHALFRDILTRDLKHRDELLLCIQWVLFAKYPLTPMQLYLGILAGSEPHYLPRCHSDDCSEDDVQRYILSTSKGLAESTKSTSPTIQFIHESVRDFLLKEDGLSRVFPDIGANIDGWSHEAIKKCCLAYMSMEELLKLEGSSRDESIERFPLLEYANNGVLYHADQAHDHGIRQDDFLTEFPQPAWVKHHNVLQKHDVRRYTPTVTLLYILAEAGTPALVRAQPWRQSCFEVEDERYGCPILAATTARNNTTVEVMLELQAERLPNFSFSNFRQRLPLDLSVSYAPSRQFTFNKKRELFPQLVEHGNELVSLFWLATKRCDIDERNKKGHTVLMTAVLHGFVALVDRLLQLRSDSSYLRPDENTLLHLASTSGRVEVLRLLQYRAYTNIINGSSIRAAL